MDRQQVTQHLAGKTFSNAAAGKARIGKQCVKRAFKIPYIGTHALGDQESDGFIQLNTTLLRLVHQNRHAGLKIRWLNGHGKTPAKT